MEYGIWNIQYLYQCLKHLKAVHKIWSTINIMLPGISYFILQVPHHLQGHHTFIMGLVINFKVTFITCDLPKNTIWKTAPKMYIKKSLHGH